MVQNLDWLAQSVQDAVIEFWSVRGEGEGVRSGKTLDPFLDIIKRVIRESGLPNAEIHSGKATSQLPGYFRPHKAWDVVVLNNGELIAALELKSQVGSIGNNFNNRTEEVLGSSTDLNMAIEELAFGQSPSIFIGYLIVVEKSLKTTRNPTIEMKFFPVMEGFLADESEREGVYSKRDDGTYPRTKGISYLDRYDVLCKRLVIKKLYSAACLVAVPNDARSTGKYESVSAETSILTFMLKLSNHCSVVASIENQKSDSAN